MNILWILYKTCVYIILAHVKIISCGRHRKWKRKLAQKSKFKRRKHSHNTNVCSHQVGLSWLSVIKITSAATKRTSVQYFISYIIFAFRFVSCSVAISSLAYVYVAVAVYYEISSYLLRGSWSVLMTDFRLVNAWHVRLFHMLEMSVTIISNHPNKRRSREKKLMLFVNRQKLARVCQPSFTVCTNRHSW